MSLDQLAKQIWIANPGITLAEARERAERAIKDGVASELRQVRVVRAEEVR